MNSPAHAFIDHSRRYLHDEYLPKIERCLEQLTDEQIWWRPNEASNSVGNLLLHLSGNIRQWVVTGVGGGQDTRNRQQEFDERTPLSRKELIEHVRTALADMDRVLAGAAPARLLEKRMIQGREVTALEAIYHAVEHFSMHTGQILYVAKMLTSEDLAFYEVRDGIARRRW